MFDKPTMKGKKFYENLLTAKIIIDKIIKEIIKTNFGNSRTLKIEENSCLSISKMLLIFYNATN